jgi:hypothetical protein
MEVPQLLLTIGVKNLVQFRISEYGTTFLYLDVQNGLKLKSYKFHLLESCDA